MKTRQTNPFTLTAASYYSWFVDETENGTQVLINLRDVRDGVMFDSLVFRTMKIPVVTETSGDSVVVKAVLPGNQSVLESRALPDSGLSRLIYSWKGERRFYEIEEFTREDSKYLKRE
ncbi:MAG: hypothetical protein U5L72_15690 [Bacteroidales bacterium]|nr:hypothetical protein [Bacteroidales bacterium]